MNLRSCSDERVHCVNRTTTGLVPCDESAAFVRDCAIDVGDSPFKPQRQPLPVRTSLSFWPRPYQIRNLGTDKLGITLSPGPAVRISRPPVVQFTATICDTIWGARNAIRVQSN